MNTKTLSMLGKIELSRRNGKMNEPEEKKAEEPKLNIFEGGLTAFLESMQGVRRSMGDTGEEWKRQLRKRAGLGGRGYTKPVKNEDKSKVRRKMARASRKKNWK
jgi:hypothetical protein